MNAYLKTWGLAREIEGNPNLQRLGTFTFTREEAERLRDNWAKEYPNAKPLFVINLKTE